MVSELFLDTQAVVAVKQTIARDGLLCLVIAMAATGGSGFALGKERKGRWIEEKKRRMPFIAGNGLLGKNFKAGLRLSGRLRAAPRI